MTTLYLTEPGTLIRFRNATLLVEKPRETVSVRIAEVEMIVVLPGIQLTSSVLAELLDRGIETLFLRQDGQFRGRLQGQFQTNPSIRLAQYRVVDSIFGLALAQRLVEGKVRNQRTLLQRRNRSTRGNIGELAEAIDTIASYFPRLTQQEIPLGRDELMGLEGICARIYYQGLRHWFSEHWQFSGRNRQPPRDPVNALLSWGYGVLLSRVFAACIQAGLDPYLGFFHATAPYRPNLVLDLMEEFRPILIDQAVIAITSGELLGVEDFEPSPDGEGIWLGSMAKKLFLGEIERRLREPLHYPPQNRRLALSQILLEQSRWLARCLVEQRLDYESFMLR